MENLEVNFWAGRRIFLTGGTGLVGSWVADALVQAKAQVTVLVQDVHPMGHFFGSGTHQHCHIVYGRFEDMDVLERALCISEAEVVIHLGAQAIVDHALAAPLLTFESNVRGTYNLLECCRRHAKSIKSIVVASTDKAYGTNEQLPYVEEMPLKGVHPYDASKVCTEIIARSYHETYGLPLILVRCGNIFGGGDLNFSRLVPGTIKSLLFDERPILRSDGTFVRDYVYVKNVARVYLSLAQLLYNGKASGEAFNYSDDNPLTVMAVVEAIARCLKKTKLKPVILNQAKHEIHDQHLSCAKLRKFVQLDGLADFEASLDETIRWYREFFRR